MINDANIIPIGRVPSYTRAIKIGNRVFPLAVYTNTSGGGGEFYKCAAVYGPYDVETVVISGCPVADANGEYLPTDQTTTDWEGKEYPIYTNGKGWYYGYSEFGGWGITQDMNNGLTYSGEVGGTWYDNMEYMPVEGMTGVKGTATLDTDVPKTWDGYKAVLSGGVYTFENTVTTGLTYSDIKPQKNLIYSADCMIKLDWLIQDYPTYGLGFFAPLTDSLTLTETGQIMTNTNAELATIDGVKCAKFYSQWQDSQIKLDPNYTIYDTAKRGYTSYFNFRVNSDQNAGLFVEIGSDFHNNMFQFYVFNKDGQLFGRAVIPGANTELDFPFLLDNWNSIVVKYVQADKNKNQVSLYLNEDIIVSYPSANLLGNNHVRIGTNGSNEGAGGFVNNVLVYNRALSEAEIGQLVDKFSPTA